MNMWTQETLRAETDYRRPAAAQAGQPPHAAGGAPHRQLVPLGVQGATALGLSGS